MGIDWFYQLDSLSIFDSLPPWGTLGRQFRLRRLYYQSGNSLVQSAIQALIRQVKQTPNELVGAHPTLVRRYQDLFQQADFGGGIDQLLSKLLVDYYTLDVGAVMEIVGPGAKDTPLLVPPVGLVALDALRCYFTGNLEFPIFYRSHRTNKLTKMHWTRVVRLVDMPSSDPFYRGMGFCALSRAAAVAQAEIAMYRLELQNLSDEPANGLLILSGMAEAKFLKKLSDFDDNRNSDQPSLLRNLIQITTTEPGGAVDGKIIPFSQLPVGYTQEESVRTHVNLLALAIGVDPQDIWPLSGQSMGSGSQSKILHAKSSGKALGDTLSLLGRTWNIAVLPSSLELRYKPRDTEREQSDANIASTWVTLSNTLFVSGQIDGQQANQLLANNVDAFADVLLDQSGALRLPSDDKKDPNEDNTVPAQKPGAPTAKPPIVAPDAKPNTLPSSRRDNRTQVKSGEGLSLVELDFTGELDDLLLAAVDGQVPQGAFGVKLRAMVQGYGRKAFEEGLLEAGVADRQLDNQDEATVAKLTLEQSTYVSNVAKAIYESRLVTDAMAAQKPTLWFNKSIYPFYLEGLKSGDQNGMYVWELGVAEKHCPDCSRLAAGHQHRLKEWLDSGYVPRSDQLSCGGFRCTCRLTRTSGPSQGVL